MSPASTSTGRSPPAARVAALCRVHSIAPGSRSTAVTRAPGCSCAIDSAIAPDPLPRSTTIGPSVPARPAGPPPGPAGAGPAGPGEPLQRPAGELLGLRPGHEHAGADGELQEPE